MATTVIERPYEINWSRNLIQYVLRTDTPLNTTGLRIEVRLMFQSLTDDLPRMLFTQPLFPDRDGIVTFYPASILNPELRFELPDLDSVAPQVIRRQSGNFHIQFREVTAATPNSEWDQTDGEDGGLTVIKGGLSYERWQGPNWFINFFAQERPFLTWQLSGRSCALDERMYLYFLMPRASVGQLSMDVRVVYTDQSEDNSVQAIFPGATPKYTLVALTTGASELGLPGLAPAKKIWYYEVSVSDDGGLLAAPFRYIIDYTHSYTRIRFNYVNSLGGVDSVRVLGKVESMLKRSFDLATITPSSAYLDGNALAPQEFAHAVSISREFKGNIGYLKRKEQHYLFDLMHSPRVVQLLYGRWFPVTITSQEMPEAGEGDELPDMPLQWKYGFENTQFTPDYVNVGSLPVCPLVTGAVVTDMTELADTLSWNGSAEHRQYVVEWFLNQPGSSNPQTSGILFVAATSVDVPHSDHGGTAIIKAVCSLGNRSAGVTINIGGPI